MRVLMLLLALGAGCSTPSAVRVRACGGDGYGFGMVGLVWGNPADTTEQDMERYVGDAGAEGHGRAGSGSNGGCTSCGDGHK